MIACLRVPACLLACLLLLLGAMAPILVGFKCGYAHVLPACLLRWMFAVFETLCLLIDCLMVASLSARWNAALCVCAVVAVTGTSDHVPGARSFAFLLLALRILFFYGVYIITTRGTGGRGGVDRLLPQDLNAEL